MLADDAAVYFRARQKGQQDRSEAREKVHPLGEMQANCIACDGSDHDFHEGNGHCHSDRDDGGEQCKAEPDSRCQPNVLHRALLPAGWAVYCEREGGTTKPASRRVIALTLPHAFTR